MFVRLLSSAAVVCMAAGPLASQDVTQRDSATIRLQLVDAVADGTRAAEGRYVGGRFFGGALAGLPLGFFGAATLMVGPNPAVLLGTGLGGGGVLIARRPGDTSPPDSLAALAALQSESYARAWRAGYSDRLTERRRKAADVGGMIGAAIGVLLIAALFSGGYT